MKQQLKKTYSVKKCDDVNTIDGVWDKEFWSDAQSQRIDINHWLVQRIHTPVTEFKLKYSSKALYVIFRVRDCFVKSMATEINGEVWKDSCVEFFFSPDPAPPNTYFNIETNCCGILLMQHHTSPRVNSRYLEISDIKKISIASSAAGPIRTEIKKPLVWTVEYCVPFEILNNYTSLTMPEPDVVWGANFYKCADGTSYPHWLGWSEIKVPEADFHRPDYFGNLVFE